MEGLRVEGYSSLACRPVAVIRKKERNACNNQACNIHRKERRRSRFAGKFFSLGYRFLYERWMFYSAKGEVRIRIIEIISVVHGKTHLGFENSV